MNEFLSFKDAAPHQCISFHFDAVLITVFACEGHFVSDLDDLLAEKLDTVPAIGKAGADLPGHPNAVCTPVMVGVGVWVWRCLGLGTQTVWGPPPKHQLFGWWSPNTSISIVFPEFQIKFLVNPGTNPPPHLVELS